MVNNFSIFLTIFLINFNNLLIIGGGGGKSIFHIKEQNFFNTNLNIKEHGTKSEREKVKVFATCIRISKKIEQNLREKKFLT